MKIDILSAILALPRNSEVVDVDIGAIIGLVDIGEDLHFEGLSCRA